MKHRLTTIIVAVLAGGAGATLAADLGSWNTADDPLWTGIWMEAYVEAGPGQPGCLISAFSVPPERQPTVQWALDWLYIPPGEQAEIIAQDGDLITWQTHYASDLELSGGLPAQLVLTDDPALWGDGEAFTDVEAVVTTQVDYSGAEPEYLWGTVDGWGTAGELDVEFYAELIETDVWGPRSVPGHEGDVTYLEVTITPEPTSLGLLALGAIGLLRRR